MATQGAPQWLVLLHADDRTTEQYYTFDDLETFMTSMKRWLEFGRKITISRTNHIVKDKP